MIKSWVLLLLLLSQTISAEIIKTQDLGWQEGQDVTQQLEALFEQN